MASGAAGKPACVAAGMISRAVINSTPTIFMEIAITAHQQHEDDVGRAGGRRPSASADRHSPWPANSAPTSISSTRDHPQSRAIDDADIGRGDRQNVRPNRKPSRSTRTQVMKGEHTSPQPPARRGEQAKQGTTTMFARRCRQQTGSARPAREHPNTAKRILTSKTGGARRHPEQRGVGQGVPKYGQPAPDDWKQPSGPAIRRDADSGEQRAGEEIIQHDGPPGPCAVHHHSLGASGMMPVIGEQVAVFRVYHRAIGFGARCHRAGWVWSVGVFVDAQRSGRGARRTSRGYSAFRPHPSGGP